MSQSVTASVEMYICHLGHTLLSLTSDQHNDNNIYSYGLKKHIPKPAKNFLGEFTKTSF